jgi:hypothetical protein
LLALTAMSGSHSTVMALLTDYRVFVRVLIAIPLLIAGQSQIEEHFSLIIQHFVKSGLICPEDLPGFRQIIATIRKLKDAWFPEIALVAVAVVSSFVVVGSDLTSGASWSVRNIDGTLSLSPAGWYFQIVTQTIYLVLLGLVLWRWFLYVMFFWRVSRLPLQLVPSDPDQAAGLGFLGKTPIAFISVVIATSAGVGSVLRFEALHSSFSLQYVCIVVALWVALILLIFVGPLAIFSGKLIRASRIGNLQYAALAHLHANQFHKKWVLNEQPPMETLLVAPELTRLTDLAFAIDRIRMIKPMPVEKVTLIILAAAAAIPMVPVMLTEVSLSQLLKVLLHALV